MPNLLAIDTSTHACSAAVWVNGHMIERCEHKPQQHAQLILALIEDTLHQAGITKKQLDAIAYACGPGSFTGIRLGAAVVQAIAFGLELPVIPVSTLLTLAQTAYRTQGWQHVLTVLDARMQEVYWCRYQLAANGLMQACLSEQLTKPSDVALPERNCYGVGDGWLAYPVELSQRLSPQLLELAGGLYPQAQDVVTHAVHAYQNNKCLTATQALPSYLRDKLYS